MRCIPFACIYLALFFSNHAHARIGETYEESVKRYTAAGFTEERTVEEIPPDSIPLGYFSFRWNDYFLRTPRRPVDVTARSYPSIHDFRQRWRWTSEAEKPPYPSLMEFWDSYFMPSDLGKIRGSSYQGLKEVTWTKKEPKEGTAIEVVSVRQLFYGEWPPTNNPKPCEPILRCFDIRYEFREPLSTISGNKNVVDWLACLFRTDDDNLTARDNDFCVGINWDNRGIKGVMSKDGKYLRIKLRENDWDYKLARDLLELAIRYEFKRHAEMKAKKVKRRQEKEVHKKPPPPPLPPSPPPPNIKKEFEESGL